MDKNGSLPASAALPRQPDGRDRVNDAITFLDALTLELDTVVDLPAPNPFLRIACYLMRAHLEARLVTPSSAVAAAGVPYATGVRRLNEMIAAGYVDQRPRSKTGKTYTVHPSETLIARFTEFGDRLPRIARDSLGLKTSEDYFFSASYRGTQIIQPPKALARPLQVSGGVRVLVHADPTFMVMGNLKRRFENVVGTTITQRAFSIDRLRLEALRNAERKVSRYDVIALDLPWLGEFVARGVLLPLAAALDVERLDPADFHPAGWQAACWGGVPYGVPNQTTPELLFYRRDLFAEAGLGEPRTTDDVLAAAAHFHNPGRGRYGIAWNAARGTALGHTFMMVCAAFGQPVLDLRPIAGGFDATAVASTRHRPTIDTPRALEAAHYLLELLRFSPPDILSMSWYERVRPYAAGKVAMAYGYTLLAPYFELDEISPAHSQTGYLPHPAGAGAANIAPIGGYVLGIPANVAPERREAAAEALIAFNSPEAQKLYVINGSRTAPRFSVGADPEVRRLSSIFQAVEEMSLRDELQFWPRPPIPEITDMIQICGEELHDMLRGVLSPAEALSRAQDRADALFTRTNE
ncbi:MAG: hypothetical protein AcusKO_06640 [Acuticoccus sp.]